MITHFPKPYPDELLYSVLARYQERMAYPAKRTVLLELFGNQDAVPVIELPSRSDQLVSVLPPTTTNTSDWIIGKHTMLPFYAPFLPQSRYEQLLEDMKGNGAQVALLRAGICAGRIRPPDFLRTCPICDKENIACYGETYWKRRHQITGVEVCPVHSVFLETTNIRRHQYGSRFEYFAAQSAERVRSARAVDQGNQTHQLLLRLAESVAWLLDYNTARPGLLGIIRRHREVLAANDLLAPNGQIRQKQLREQVSECYGDDLLRYLNYAGVARGWPARLFKEKGIVFAPIRHLLLMNALNVSAEDFFCSAFKPEVTRQKSLDHGCPRQGTLLNSESEIKRRKDQLHAKQRHTNDSSPCRGLQSLKPQHKWSVDWNARDGLLARRVTSAAAHIRNFRGRFRRVTVSSICNELGLPAYLRLHRNKLPLTVLALRAQVESTEQFALRRIGQAVEIFVIKRRSATPSQLINCARVRIHYDKPAVRQAIIDAVHYLDHCQSRSRWVRERKYGFLQALPRRQWNSPMIDKRTGNTDLTSNRANQQVTYGKKSN